jgi:hypothetical protein
VGKHCFRLRLSLNRPVATGENPCPGFAFAVGSPGSSCWRSSASW